MKKHSDKNDKTLVELTLLGDESAYEELVIRHQRAVMGTAYKVTNNSYSAEDASQDAFVSAWMNLSSLRDGAKFGAWVCSIAKNCARTLDAHYRSTVPDISLDLLENCDLSDENCDDYADVHEAVEALSEKIREAIKLHYFEDKSVAEIAELLSVPVGTVKWRLSEGRKQLRKGYGIMEKTYNENENLVARVMRQVEALKLWRLKNDRNGFEEEYHAVLHAVEALDDSKEKSFLLADTLLMGYWWLPGAKNDEVFARIKKAAEDGHNDEVMMSIANAEHSKFSGRQKIDFMKNTQIPYYREQGYPKTLAYVLFWLGYEYRCQKEYEEAIKCFEQILTTVPPTDVYYANAKAAIEGEKRSLQAKNDSTIIYYQPEVTGEVYKLIGDKLYFWTQPGYGHSIHSAEGCLFWNLAACDNLMLDYGMAVGDKTISSDGKTTLTYCRNDGICDTPAGHFENCSVYVLQGEHYGLTWVETWLCEKAGIVRQIVTRNGETHEWVLSSCQINGGDGLLPFAVGNRWEYAMITPETGCLYERENIFEVTAYEHGSVTLSAMQFTLSRGYFDTWEGKTLEARECYYYEVDTDTEKLRDVSLALARSAELAMTKRQKVHTAIANDVMNRIFATDPDFNPHYTERGRWNFFEYDKIEKKNGLVSYVDYRKYSFEWKAMGKCGNEGHKVLYTFLLTILQDATGCVWSDEWIDGYSFDKKKVGQYTTKDFSVKGGETVTTPAGTFENCRHISFDFSAWGYFSGRSDYWFAPGVGLVKFEHPFGEGQCAAWQLTHYSGTGEGYFPTDDGLFRHYEPLSLGDGWHGSLEYTFDENENGTVMFKNALGNQDRANYEKGKKK